MATPEDHLNRVLAKATKLEQQSAVRNADIREKIDFVCRCLSNRAGVRLLMSCMLAKLDRPQVDPRKPYTEIGDDDCFSGRTYDERYLGHFINENRLPCNSTTAFLTPTLRNQNSLLTPEIELVGRPREVYKFTLELLDSVARNKTKAEDVLTETIRVLLVMRDEKLERMSELISSLNRGRGALPLSSEAIVTLLSQHLACKHSSRLPVLIIAAAYESVGLRLGERIRPLNAHNAADEQTGALGDVEVCLTNDDQVRTIYEMKSKRVLRDDIDRAVQKLAINSQRVDNYVFITTDRIDEDIREYALSMYEQMGGTEFVVLDCLGFLRHFLHLFHRMRLDFVDAYQNLVLNEPDSAVNQSLKEAFLTLRQAAESDE